MPTISRRTLEHDEALEDAELGDLTPQPIQPRPRVRGDCARGPRPCGWVSCRHHLYLETKANGGLKVNTSLPVWEMEDTCSLDVADEDGATLERVGEIMAISKERVRQLEARGLRKLKRRVDDPYRDVEAVDPLPPVSHRDGRDDLEEVIEALGMGQERAWLRKHWTG